MIVRAAPAERPNLEDVSNAWIAACHRLGSFEAPTACDKNFADFDSLRHKGTCRTKPESAERDTAKLLRGNEPVIGSRIKVCKFLSESIRGRDMRTSFRHNRASCVGLSCDPRLRVRRDRTADRNAAQRLPLACRRACTSTRLSRHESGSFLHSGVNE
jgi:hypothetical protein